MGPESLKMKNIEEQLDALGGATSDFAEAESGLAKQMLEVATRVAESGVSGNLPGGYYVTALGDLCNPQGTPLNGSGPAWHGIESHLIELARLVADGWIDQVTEQLRAQKSELNRLSVTVSALDAE
jgi:hypothetical protein